MALIAYKTFGGEIPRNEPYLLPQNNAQFAMNCDFVSGALRPLKNGLELFTMVNNPIKGIYTEDGVNFYTWQAETHAFQSPIIEDEYNRMYFLTPSVGKFSVTSKLNMSPSGPTPVAGNVYQVGVPRPTVAPALSLLERSTLPEYPSINIKAEAWWDSAGTAYGKTDVVLTSLRALRNYSFSAPARPFGTPGTAVLKVTFHIEDILQGNQDILSLTMRQGETARSSSLPGGTEGELTLNDDMSVGLISLEWGPTETRAYTYTNVNSWNEESAPAPAATISPTYVQDVQVTVTPESFTGYRPFLEYHIFRTYGTNATYIKTNVGGTAPNFIDSSRTPDSVGYALESMDWTPLPSGIECMVLMPNGWFAASKGNTLYMSEPYYPHGFPYTMTFSHSIRGLCPGQQSLVVTCADGVYVVAGDNPSSANQIKLSLPQAGIAQRSMTTIDGAVAYASQDGIAVVAGTAATMEVSQKLFNRKDWRDMYGEILQDASMRFAYHDGFLVVSSDTEAIGFVLRLDEATGTLSQTNERMDSTFLLPVNDTLYYSLANKVYQYQAGTNKSFEWWGRDVIFPRYVTFGAGFIRCEGAVTFALYADGAKVYEATLTSGHFRLPELQPQLRWSINLKGAGTIYEFAIAQSMLELQRT